MLVSMESTVSWLLVCSMERVELSINISRSVFIREVLGSISTSVFFACTDF